MCSLNEAFKAESSPRMPGRISSGHPSLVLEEEEASRAAMERGVVARARPHQSYYASHRLERPVTADNMQVWVLILERHHETCPVEDWLKVLEALKVAILAESSGGSKIQWTCQLRAAFETAKVHLVIHWLTYGLIPANPPLVLPVYSEQSTPRQGELKKYLAYVRLFGYSVRIKDWYLMVKEVVALALTWAPDYHWSLLQQGSWAQLIKVVVEIQNFDLS